MSCTSFSFLTIRANLKKNDSCAVCFVVNFKQQHSYARFLRKFYLKQQIEDPWILLTELTHLGKFTVARCLSRNVQVKQ